MLPSAMVNFTASTQGIKTILARLPKSAEVFLVGGAVRDILLKRKIKDLDLLVRKISLNQLKSQLKNLGAVDSKGEKWGVLTVKIGKQAIDVALPRREKAKNTGKYFDFEITAKPNLPVKTDLKRRDFTINALAWDLKKAKLLDPFGGVADLRKKQISTVGQPKQRFAEDHSRILRALRLAAELNFKFEPKTWAALVKTVKTLPQLNIRPKIWRMELKKITQQKKPFQVLCQKAGLVSVAGRRFAAKKYGY
ncbi:CCA tRNA nucleotidyltransferase [Candidatus Parcubacteria bacterium]|jgi:tRNA nucleotidyltransferase/poly(A) polymerase|nr:MAG: CCA tRNA nucleotidyltransferase [Candidatus Parcubacteria bacterium]